LRRRILVSNPPTFTPIGTGTSLFPALSQLLLTLRFLTQKHGKDGELKRLLDEHMNANMQLCDELQLVEY
jgi:hypothetical protein